MQGLYNFEPQLSIMPDGGNGNKSRNQIHIPSFIVSDDKYLFELISQSKIFGRWEPLMVVTELWHFVDVEDLEDDLEIN